MCGTGARGSGLQVIHLQELPAARTLGSSLPVPEEELAGGEEGLPAEPALGWIVTKVARASCLYCGDSMGAVLVGIEVSWESLAKQGDPSGAE